MSRHTQTESPITIAWPPASTHPQLNANEVHIWAANLDVAPDSLTALSATLSSAERERAGQFRFEKLQKRYAAGRGLLRSLLGRYLSIDAARLDFVFSSRGKPALAETFASTGIHFNLAHSENLALFAFTQSAPLGVDVERIRPIKDVEELVARFFSQRESDLFRRVAADQHGLTFFNLWTRKEALLKATGEGIAGRLKEFEVTLLPGEPARLLSIGTDRAQALDWSLHDLAPAPGFVGALALRANDVQLKCWKSQ